ncbi:MAG: glycerophosphodiester phosphodiesterase [Promethearchaeota archaeon]
MTLLEKLQTKKGKIWLGLYITLLINFLLIDAIFIMLQNSWGDINLIVSDYIGIYINIILIIVLVFIIPINYGGGLFISYYQKLMRENEINPHFANKIIPLVLIIFFDLIIIALFIIYWQYTKVVFQIMEYYCLIVNFLLCVALIILLYPLIKYLPKLNTYFSEKRLKSITKRNIISGILIVLYGFYFITPTILVPANVVYDDLPPKPEIMGHRGASHLAPENTLIALQVAADYGAIGVEIDVRATSDGELVLMHDATLTRTTNIAEVYPEKKDDKISTFTLNQLRKLDAGSYFYKFDPYGAIAEGLISEKQAKAYVGTRIPTLLEAINLSRDLDFLIDFDTKFSDNSLFEKMLNETLISGIPLDHVMIITDKPEWIQMIKDKGMNDLLLGINMRDNPSLERYQRFKVKYEFVSCGDDFSNILYRQFYSEDIPSLVYIIDNSERFNQLWCMGVTWIMTNEVHIFNALETPLYLPIDQYIILWIIIYISGMISIVFICFKKKQ